MSNSTASVATTTEATAAVVRAAFREGKFTLPAGVSTASLLGKDGTGEKVRGRLAPAAMDAFLASKAGKGYTRPHLGNRDENGDPIVRKTPAKTVTMVEVPRVSAKNGRPIKSVTLPRAEVLALAGEPADKRGRLSAAVLAKAGAAHVAANPSKPSGRKAKAAPASE